MNHSVMGLLGLEIAFAAIAGVLVTVWRRRRWNVANPPNIALRNVGLLFAIAAVGLGVFTLIRLLTAN